MGIGARVDGWVEGAGAAILVIGGIALASALQPAGTLPTLSGVLKPNHDPEDLEEGEEGQGGGKPLLPGQFTVKPSELAHLIKSNAPVIAGGKARWRDQVFASALYYSTDPDKRAPMAFDPAVGIQIGDFTRNVYKLAQVHDSIWRNWDQIRVNSWYRTPRVNSAIGGSKTSRHRFGLAMDIAVHPLTHYAGVGRTLDGLHNWLLERWKDRSDVAWGVMKAGKITWATPPGAARFEVIKYASFIHLALPHRGGKAL